MIRVMIQESIDWARRSGEPASWMNRQALGGVIVALALVAAIGFGVVAMHEFNYASDHAYAYGPAKVIAWGALTGALLAIAVALAGYALTREGRD